MEAVANDLDATAIQIERGLTSEAVLLSAGVSVGERDYARAALARFGDIQSWRLQMRPVRPLAFGRIGRTLVFGLPGNPVASFLAFELLVRPALRALAGHSLTGRPELSARMEESLDNSGGVLTFVRAILSSRPQPIVRSAGGQGTANLVTLTRANCLIVVPEGTEHVETGAEVRVRLLSGDA